MLCVTGIIDAWNGNKSHVLLAKVWPYKVFYPDISQLGPGQELESEVLLRLQNVSLLRLGGGK